VECDDLAGLFSMMTKTPSVLHVPAKHARGSRRSCLRHRSRRPAKFASRASFLRNTAHLANTAQAAKTALHVDKLEAVADRGYFDGEEILACDQAGITVTLPKPQRSGAKSEGRFGKQDFVYLADENVYRCPAGEKLKYYYTNEEKGQKLHRYWTNAGPPAL
jgi:hypothetical protein